MEDRNIVMMLCHARDKAKATAQRNAADYIRWNPGDRERRNKYLSIELAGIDNLYHSMIEEIKNSLD